MAWNTPPQSPWQRKQDPKDLDEMLNKLQQQIKGHFRKGGMLWIIIVIVGLIWGGYTSVFVVNPEEEAVVKRFGEFHRIVGPGPRLKFPSPVETFIKENVTSVRRQEIGFRTIDFGPPARYRQIPRESLMLTGDENIIDVQFTVQFRIRNLEHYLFNISDPVETVKSAGESAMREVIGHTTVDDALTTGKEALESKTKTLLQEILNRYEAGIHVENVKLQDVHPPDPVKEAFKDVTSAKEDREKMIREAEGYANNLIPRARGRAEEILNQAKAYHTQKTLHAEGESKRFESVYEEYRQAKEITRARIRIETMEAVLPHVNKVLADSKLGDNVLPFLPIQSQTNSGNAPSIVNQRQP